MATSDGAVTKIYSLQTTGYDGVLNNLQNLSKAFAALRQEKERLNKLSGQIEDPAKLANINAQLDKLTIQERQLTQEIKSQIGVSDRMRVVRQSEADGTNKSISAFAKLNRSYKEAKANMKEMAAEYGAESEQALAAAASFKIYKDQLEQIVKLKKSGGTTAPANKDIPFTTNVAQINEENERVSTATGPAVSAEETAALKEQLLLQQQATAYYETEQLELDKLNGILDANAGQYEVTAEAIEAYVQQLNEAQVGEEKELSLLEQITLAYLSVGAELNDVNAEVKLNKTAYDEGALSEEKYLQTNIELTAQQAILKGQFAEARAELNAQVNAAAILSKQQVQSEAAEAKAVALTTSEYKLLSQALKDQELRYTNLRLVVGENNAATKAALADGKSTRALLDSVDESLDNNQRKVGSYSSAIGKSFSRFTSFDGIISKLINNIGRMGIHFLAFSLIIKGVEFLIEKISDAFDKMSGKFDKAAVASKGLQDALGDNTYKDAVTNVQRLGIEVDLASKGLYSQKEALDDYNKSLGDALGKANSFADVQKKISDKDLTNAYIEAMLYRAAATKILQQASEDAAKAAIENQVDKDVVDDPRASKYPVGGTRGGIKQNADGTFSASMYTNADIAKENIDKRNKVTKDNNDKYINIASDFYKKVAALEKQFHINTSGDNKGKTDELSSAQQNALKQIDAYNAIAVAKENERYEKIKETRKLTVEDEVEHLTTLKDINNRFDSERIAAVKGTNNEEQKFRAETSLKIIKNTNDTFDKIKELRLKHYDEEKEQLKKQYEETQAAYKKQFEDESQVLKKHYDAGTAGANLDNETVQKSPVASETQKAISQADYNDTQLARAKQYYADLEDAAVRNKQDLAKIEEDKNKTLADLQAKGILDSQNIQKAYLRDIETDSENQNQQRLISDGAAIVKLYENRKLTTQQRNEQIAAIQRQYDQADLQRLKDLEAKELPILKALFALQLISAKDYLAEVQKIQAAIDAATQKVASKPDYKDAPTLGEELKDKAPEQGQGLEGIWDNTAQKLFHVDPDSAGGKIIGESFNFADQAMNAYFDAEQRRIENSLKQTERIIDAQKRTALSHAQSSAEMDTIDRQFAAKSLAAEKAAFEKTKKVQRQQAEVSLLEQIGNAWAAAFKLGPLAAPFYGAAMTVLALGRYALQVSAINAQQFASGGQVQPVKLSNGKISAKQNIPTQPNGDNVLATVKVGEVILNEEHQQRAGGAAFFRSLGVPGFATGGVVNFNPYPYAPQFTPAAYYVNQTNNGITKDDLKELTDRMEGIADEQSRRIDRIQVQQVTSTVTSAQKKQVKQTSLGRL